MKLPDRTRIAFARSTVAGLQPPTPLWRWPLLDARTGARVWVKHENHTRVGAFKLRGGIVYLQAVREREPSVTGIVSATRGNHGQSLALAAARLGLGAVIVVPHGNSREKNAAMRALGAELIEHGEDFQAASEHAEVLARERGLHRVPSFHEDLVCGVASYWMEVFEAVQPDVAFVPIGMGSGIVACAAARAACGVRTRIVGVVSAHATAYAQSFAARRVIEAPVSTRLADGLACRVPSPEALAFILQEVDDIVQVSDAEVAAAMRALFSDTHNVAEGGGAAALAGLLQRREAWQGRDVAVPLTGGNVDAAVFAGVLADGAADSMADATVDREA